MTQTMTAQETPAIKVRKMRAVKTCDLCGSDALEEIAEATSSRCRTVMCQGCGLFFASPSLAVEELEDFYDDEFEGDAGTNRRVGGEGIETRKIAKEESIARDWAMPIITEHMDLADKTVLDIRCRSGGLAEMLSKAGAVVTAIDPLEPNADHARARNTIAQVDFLPVTQFTRLVENGYENFDAVTALTIHTLGHMPSPKAFLKSIFGTLKPGGYLFIDEKDLFYPARTHGSSVFDTGTAHFFHFSIDTIRGYLSSVGFEVLECGLDPARKKAFRHVRTVARKPLEGETAAADIPVCDPQARKAALHQAQASMQRKRLVNKLARKTRAAVRKVWS